jgi:ankyrin repeat protein
MAELDREGRSPLHYAAAENNQAQALARLTAGDDPNLGDRRGFAPLHFAAQAWAVDIARMPLDRGAQVDAMNVFGNTPLFVAVFNSKGRGELITLLREKGADPYNANKAGQTPIGLARLIGNYDVARYFADLP